MNLRIASALLALALPLAAQEPAADLATENMFLKAYYLEGMQKDFVGAMALYEQFLAKAPDHKFAKDAARQQYRLLDKTGKSKERDAFKAKYEKLLGDIQPSGAGGGDAAGGEGRGQRGEGRGENRMDMQARMADLEKQIAKAKEAGDEAKVKELTAQLERMKQAGNGERPQRGQGMNQKKLTEMSADELATFKKDGLGRMETMLERGRERMGEETAKKMETHLTALKASLEANKLEDAQKEMDAIREAMRAGMGGGRRGRDGGGEGGGAGGGAGRPAGGGGAGGPGGGGGER